MKKDFDADVKAELLRARGLWPGRRHLLAALMEEVGEVARALLDREGDECLWSECVQVAVLAQRIAEEGEESFDGW